MEKIIQPTRRNLLRLCASLPTAALSLDGGQSRSARIGLVQSVHPKLRTPVSLEHSLTYEIVREMVWKAIEYGRPAAGSLEAAIRPGSWVVVKPNFVFLPPQGGWRPGDTTDLRVIQAVVEYVATRSRAARITIAEGGSFRRPSDPSGKNLVLQDKQPVDALTYRWDPKLYPGTGGSVQDMLLGFSRRFPGKRFDFVDLNYDCVRDAAGRFVRLPVPDHKGAGGFGARDYFVSKTITGCDFLISVPVMKIHDLCGITVCFKNYVGTAPREAWSRPGQFSNNPIHVECSIDGRIDPFIADLARYHPPNYNVIDGIRGLQYDMHNKGYGDQEVQTNTVLAGEDAVACDSLAAHVMGMNPWDIDYLHYAEEAGMGNRDLSRVELNGDDPSKMRRYWARPRKWYGRCNRVWQVSSEAGLPWEAWKSLTTRGDTLRASHVPGKPYWAGVRFRSQGHARGFLWVGVEGHMTAVLNGVTVTRQFNTTRYRIGQFQVPVEVRPGINELVFEVRPLTGTVALSALISGPRNDGDTMEGIRWPDA